MYENFGNFLLILFTIKNSSFTINKSILGWKPGPPPWARVPKSGTLGPGSLSPGTLGPGSMSPGTLEPWPSTDRSAVVSLEIPRIVVSLEIPRFPDFFVKN